MTLSRKLAAVLGIALLLVSGCTKKTPVAVAPPPQVEVPPPPPKPAPPTIVAFVVEPSLVEQGQSAVVRWEVNDAEQVRIDPGFGSVAAKGDRRVSPEKATTYRLLATGPGGQVDASVTLDVMAPLPPPPTPPVAPRIPTLSERLQQEVQDAYFDFDKNELRPDAREALTADAEALKRIFTDYPNMSVIIEGHCDERGSAEYNLGLGDRRATAAKEFLQALGIGSEQLMAISYGKERPQCTQSNEECWQKNRRVHFVAGEPRRVAQMNR